MKGIITLWITKILDFEMKSLLNSGRHVEYALPSWNDSEHEIIGCAWHGLRFGDQSTLSMLKMAVLMFICESDIIRGPLRFGPLEFVSCLMNFSSCTSYAVTILRARRSLRTWSNYQRSNFVFMCNFDHVHSWKQLCIQSITFRPETKAQ